LVVVAKLKAVDPRRVASMEVTGVSLDFKCDTPGQGVNRLRQSRPVWYNLAT